MSRELLLEGNSSFEALPYYPEPELGERLPYRWPIDSSYVEYAGDEGPLDWMDAASCAQIGSDDTFFPGKGVSNEIQKRICDRCYVEADCKSLSLENNASYGIWGGNSEHDRRSLKNRKNVA